jgi:hypothetical protein
VDKHLSAVRQEFSDVQIAVRAEFEDQQVLAKRRHSKLRQVPVWVRSIKVVVWLVQVAYAGKEEFASEKPEWINSHALSGHSPTVKPMGVAALVDPENPSVR